MNNLNYKWCQIFKNENKFKILSLKISGLNDQIIKYLNKKLYITIKKRAYPVRIFQNKIHLN